MTRHCIDCVHFEDSFGKYGALCNHPVNSPVDRVTGERRKSTTLCAYMRLTSPAERGCGTDAVLFARRPPTFYERLRQWLSWQPPYRLP